MVTPEKETLVKRILTFQKLVDEDQPGRAKIVLDVWLEDLEPFTIEEIKRAWKKTRIRAKFFNLPELIEDLLEVHEEYLDALCEAKAKLYLGAFKGDFPVESLDDASRRIYANDQRVDLFMAMPERATDEGITGPFKSKYREAIDSVDSEVYLFETPEQKRLSLKEAYRND